MGNSEELPPDNGMIDGTRDKFSTPVLVNPDIFQENHYRIQGR